MDNKTIKYTLLFNDANYEQALIAFKLMIKMVRYGNTKEG